MQSISLIVLNTLSGSAATLDIPTCRQMLQELAGEARVEIILAGAVDDRDHPGNGVEPRVVPTPADEPVGALRAGIQAASGELLVVLDSRRSYSPSALAQVVGRLRNSEAELAIAVPKRQRGRPWWQALGRRCLGLASEASLGTSDVFSGLMAVRRSSLSDVPTMHHPRGSRIVLDLLAWPCGVHRDVPVDTLPDDRLNIGRLSLNDTRQLKRVLDQRFGTFSRLIQFCMVGASGMVVDLSFYALFQMLFARIWPGSMSHSPSQFSWPLASARALAILVALVWNFTLNRRLTFNDSRSGSIVRQFLTYTLGNALGIAVSMTLSLWLPMRLTFFAQHRLAAAVVGIIVATGISFSMSRWVVFIRRPAGMMDDQVATTPAEAPLHEAAVVS
jgi:dolichol-phosphate mannosyltransferase